MKLNDGNGICNKYEHARVCVCARLGVWRVGVLRIVFTDLQERGGSHLNSMATIFLFTE